MLNSNFIRKFSGKVFLQKILENVNKNVKPGLPSSVTSSVQKSEQQSKSKTLGIEEATVEQNLIPNKIEKKWGENNPYSTEGHRLQYSKSRPPAEPWDLNNPILNSSSYIQKHKMYLKSNGIGQLSPAQQEFLEAVRAGTIDTPEHRNNYLHKDSNFTKEHPEGLRIGRVKNATNISPGSANQLPENLGGNPSVTVPEHYCTVGKHEETKVLEMVVFTSSDKIEHKLTDISNEVHEIQTYKVSDTNLLGKPRPQACVNYTIVTSEQEVIVTHQPHLETEENLHKAYKAFLNAKTGYAYTEDSRRVLTQIVDRDNINNVVSEVYSKEFKDVKANSVNTDE